MTVKCACLWCHFLRPVDCEVAAAAVLIVVVVVVVVVLRYSIFWLYNFLNNGAREAL